MINKKKFVNLDIHNLYLIIIFYTLMGAVVDVVADVGGALNNNNDDEEDRRIIQEQMEQEKLKYGEFDDIFAKYDMDGNGCLDDQEIKMALKSYVLKHKDKKPQVDELLNQLELSGDYKLTKDDFRSMMICFIGNKDPIDEIIDVFKVFDKNLSAMIGPHELTHVFGKLGLNLSEEESKILIKEGDTDSDDVIDFHEFIAIMISK